MGYAGAAKTDHSVWGYRCCPFPTDPIISDGAYYLTRLRRAGTAAVANIVITPSLRGKRALEVVT